MKIAFIVNKFPCLSETFILSQITGLIDRGYVVDIFAAKSAGESTVHKAVKEYNLLDNTIYYGQLPVNMVLRFVKAVGLIFANLKKNPGSLVKSLNVLKYGKRAASLSLLYTTISFLDSRPYDIIHCHFGPFGNLGVILKDIGVLRGKLIVTFHGYDVYLCPASHGGNIYLDLFGKVDLVTANSNFTRDKVIKLGCNHNDIVRLPVGLDTAKFAFKERKFKPGEKIRILTVARFVEKKGIKYSIEAVAKIIKKYPTIRYKIVGDGPLRNQLKELIRQLGVENNVTLSGWMDQDEIQRLYSEAHIFILSSVTASNGNMEGQGLVLQEAQAMGIPVIATLHNGFPESVVDGESGYLVPERNVDSLAERLEHVIERFNDWPAMGRIGREFVEENFDINKLNDRLVDIYHKVINNRPMEDN